MIDFLGFLAGALVLLTFAMRSMMWLRLVAIGSNMAFLVYGLAVRLMPIWLLHAMLLPLNLLRLEQMFRVRQTNPIRLPHRARPKNLFVTVRCNGLPRRREQR
ncbi:MAG: hypothetical protein AAF526_01385 [Pseudomonadota bacterium]